MTVRDNNYLLSYFILFYSFLLRIILLFCSGTNTLYGRSHLLLLYFLPSFNFLFAISLLVSPLIYSLLFSSFLFFSLRPCFFLSPLATG